LEKQRPKRMEDKEEGTIEYQTNEGGIGEKMRGGRWWGREAPLPRSSGLEWVKGDV